MSSLAGTFLILICGTLSKADGQLFMCYVIYCRYSLEQQEALVRNVFLTGGNMLYPGMKERVERELLAVRPFQSHFQVCEAALHTAA